MRLIGWPLLAALVVGCDAAGPAGVPAVRLSAGEQAAAFAALEAAVAEVPECAVEPFAPPVANEGAPPTPEADQGLISPPVAEPVVIAPAPSAVVASPAVRSAPVPISLPVLRPSRDQFPAIDDNGVVETAAEPVSTFSIDVDTSSYAFVRASLRAGQRPPADAVRVEEMINYFPYAYPAPAEGPFATHVAIAQSPWSDNQILRIALQGRAEAKPPRANLVFLIDSSGSMNDPAKLPLLKASFRLLLGTLDPDDTVAIVTYAGQAGVRLAPTPVAQRRTILAALDSIGAGGGTAGRAGIDCAYALAAANYDPQAVNRVILATDGDFNIGGSRPARLERVIEEKRRTGIYLSVLGFGRGNYNDRIAQTLAQAGNGVAAYIDSISEAQKALVDEGTGQLFPIADDVKIQVTFNPERVRTYRLIGYETRALAAEDFDDDAVDAGEIGAGHRVTALYEIAPLAGTGPLATLAIRHKRPGEATSRLIERSVTDADAGAADGEMRWAMAVAGVGQLLRGGPHVGNWTYRDAAALARSARGADPYGHRAEFIALIGRAARL